MRSNATKPAARRASWVEQSNGQNVSPDGAVEKQDLRAGHPDPASGSLP
jgi:hypothetical protein